MMCQGMEDTNRRPWSGSVLAICLSVKDQNEDLREWVDYHLAIGVDKIYVMDDSSATPPNEALIDYITQSEHP